MCVKWARLTVCCVDAHKADDKPDVCVCGCALFRREFQTMSFIRHHQKSTKEGTHHHHLTPLHTHTTLIRSIIDPATRNKVPYSSGKRKCVDPFKTNKTTRRMNLSFPIEGKTKPIQDIYKDIGKNVFHFILCVIISTWCVAM